MKWSNLQTMDCPSCSTALVERSVGYECTECEFFITHEKFQSVVKKMYDRSGNRYDPDAIDRSGWDW